MSATLRPPSLAGLVVVAVSTLECGGASSSPRPDTPATTAPTTTTEAIAPTATPAPTATAAPTPLFIASVRWVTIGERVSLEVTPTSALRSAPSRAAGEAAWSEIVRAMPAANTAGMENQFLCHVQFASTKAVFHLEPWRPAVGYLRTVLAACNPGGADADLQQ